MSRKKKSKIATIGKKVINEAKKLAKEHPRWSWKRAMKEAGKIYRKKHRRKRK